MTETAKHLQCKRCNQHFECNVDSIAVCQCNTVKLKPETLTFLEKTSWGCLCAACLDQIDKKIEMTKNVLFPTASELKEQVHYYIENGLWVFTEYYHMLRGHCCKSGCRHCPYGYKK